MCVSMFKTGANSHPYKVNFMWWNCSMTKPYYQKLCLDFNAFSPKEDLQMDFIIHNNN